MKQEIKDAVLEVLENGIYYYDRYGKVSHLYAVDVNTNVIKRKIGTRQIYFKWEDLNKKFFLNEESAIMKANEYLDKLKELNITLSLIKKVFKFVKDFNSYSYDSTLYEKVVRGDNTYTYDATPNYCFFDKEKLALICEYEYDDDYGGGYTETEYPLKDYKRTWAFKESELKELI